MEIKWKNQKKVKMNKCFKEIKENYKNIGICLIDIYMKKIMVYKIT